MRKQQTGFGVVEVVIALVVVILIALGGWYVWSANQKNQNANSNSQPPSTATNKPSAKAVSLGTGKATFTLPNGWSERGQHTTNCMHTLASNVTCLDQVSIFPDEVKTDSPLPSYGGVKVAIYKHADSTTAKEWYEKNYWGSPVPSNDIVETSVSTIDGHDAYYFKLDGGSYTNINYVITTKDHVVLAHSEVKNSESPDGKPRSNDYTKYEPAIKALITSVKF